MYQVHPHLLWHLQPSLLVLRSQALVVGVQEVLKLDAGLLADHRGVGAMVEHVREGLDQLEERMGF